MKTSSIIAHWLEYRDRLAALQVVQRSTVTNQAAIAMRLIDGLPGDIAALRKSSVEIYIGERRKTCAPVTIRGEINVLRQILNWAVDEGHLLVKPRLPSVPVPNVEVALPADADFTAMLALLPENHRLACEFMMLTGLSPHELERLHAGDVGGRTLMIGYRDDFKVKTPSRRRGIPLNARALEIWNRCERECLDVAFLLPVFPNVGAIQKAMSRARAGSDLPAITPKSMRKWFASQVSGDNPEHVLQRLMGHSPGSKVTRKHYVRSTDDETRSAVDGLAVVGLCDSETI